MCTPPRSVHHKTSCPAPRRSKLQRLRRLQRKVRAQKPDKHCEGKKRRQLVQQPLPAKRQKDDANHIASAAEGSPPLPSKLTAAVPTSQLCVLDDVATLRARLRSTQKAVPTSQVCALDDITTIFRSTQKATPTSRPCALEDVATLRARLQLRVEDDPYGDCPAPITSFAELARLPHHVLRSLERHGITSPMPIQAQALPLVLSGRDVIGLAQTGSGKTLAFLLPAAVHMEKQPLRETPRVPAPFVLVLAPTRELAVQIGDEANKVFDRPGDGGQVHTVPLYGGGDKFTQQKKLRWGAHIVVATPGRLTDFVNTAVLALHRVTYLVLDEADRMLDMGFHDDVASIAKKLRPERQVLFFSATWNKDVQHLAQGLCRRGSQPVRISYGQESNAATGGAAGKHKAREGIIQEVIVVDQDGADHWEKQEAEKEVVMDKHLKQVLTASEDHKVLVFVSQKVLADKLSNRLQARGFKADAMHGGKSQDYRLWVLDQFRKGELRVLVCTDVLSRGIDIPSVSHVVIHEMGEIEDYIHRIGRTARGRYGKGHTLVFFEYWDGYPTVAAELIDVLVASKQPVPTALQKIADEVASGKRKSRSSGPSSWPDTSDRPEERKNGRWKGGGGEWKPSFFSKQGNKW